MLCRVPATFLKDHSRRAEPVLLSYQRPHLSVDPRSHRLTGLFWSPPFEGPLVGLTLVEIEEYYEAYRVLHKAIESAPAWRQRMAPGEMLVFNNRRMLQCARAPPRRYSVPPESGPSAACFTPLSISSVRLYSWSSQRSRGL